VTTLAADSPISAPSWRRLGTPLLRLLRLSAVTWEVWDALCELQAGRHRYVWGGVEALMEMTGRPNRSHLRKCRDELVRLGIIRCAFVGGGRLFDPDHKSPGQANSYVLGPAVEAYWEARPPRLRVVKNGTVGHTVVDRRTVRSGIPLNGTVGHTPPSSSSDSLNPRPQKEDDVRMVGPGGLDPEFTPDDSPSPNPGQLPLGDTLAPVTSPRARGSVRDFLDAPLPVSESLTRLAADLDRMKTPRRG